MHFLTFATLFPLISAKVLVSYNASHSDSVSVLDQQNLEGWQGADWPKGQAQNASAYFSAGFDPSGVHAAHIHRDANFVRSEYHALSGDTVKDTTYYIGYRVMWQNVDYQTIVWQWKEYLRSDLSNIPLCLVFRKDANSKANNTITFAAQQNPNEGGGTTVWSQKLTMGTTYRFGIVVDTSQNNGFAQLYFNGKLVSLADPTNGGTTTTLPGNFFPGRADPKFGLYGGKNFLPVDSYIYNVVIGTELKDIKDVAGI